jgi:hypothetical protein
MTVTLGLSVSQWVFEDDGLAPVAAATITAAPKVAAQEGETIKIPTLGLTAVRPSGWFTITADANSRNIRSVQMADPEFQALAARYANSPVIAFSKFQEPYPDLNPSFKINVRPLGGFSKFSPEDILTAALPAMRRVSNDMKVLEGPKAAQVSGRKAAYARLSYTLKAQNISVPTISEVWIVPKGTIFFMIGVGTRADQKNGSRSEMRRIVDTLQIK